MENYVQLELTFHCSWFKKKNNEFWSNITDSFVWVLQILVACLFGIGCVRKIAIPGARLFQGGSADALAFACAIKARRAP